MNTQIIFLHYHNCITRFSIILVLLFSLGKGVVDVYLDSSEFLGSVSVQESSISLSTNNWEKILEVLQDNRNSPPQHPNFSEHFLMDEVVSNQIPFDYSPLTIAQWLQLAHIYPTDAQASMSFGFSAAIDGDTVIVGAYWDHHIVTGGGSAYVFVKPEEGWSVITQTAKLTASDAAFQDTFGWSVAISGDTVVVGAPGDDSTGIYGHGSAYVFEKPGGGWTDMTETAKLTAGDMQSSDEFGRNLAISNDTIVIGVAYDDIDSNVNQGSAYVFQKPISGWANMTETAKLLASDGVAGDGLGASTAIDGNTIVVGAYAHNNGYGIGSGQVYVFNQSGDWTSGTENARLTASDSTDHEYFGWSAAIDDDVVVIGAPGEVSFDSSGEDSAYVFIKPGGGWSGDLTEEAILIPSDGLISDNFGHSIAISNDFIIVGSPYDDNGIIDKQGSAYIFSKPGSGWVNMTESEKLIASDGNDGDEFGNVVSISGITAIISAHKDDIEVLGDNTGSTYIFGAFLPTDYIYLPLMIR